MDDDDGDVMKSFSNVKKYLKSESMTSFGNINKSVRR